MLWILVTFNTCQRDIKCWMSERVGSIKFCFVIDEQKKKIDSYVIIPVGQVLDFFSMSNSAHLARNSSNRVSNNRLE